MSTREELHEHIARIERINDKLTRQNEDLLERKIELLKKVNEQAARNADLKADNFDLQNRIDRSSAEIVRLRKTIDKAAPALDGDWASDVILSLKAEVERLRSLIAERNLVIKELCAQNGIINDEPSEPEPSGVEWEALPLYLEYDDKDAPLARVLTSILKHSKQLRQVCGDLLRRVERLERGQV